MSLFLMKSLNIAETAGYVVLRTGRGINFYFHARQLPLMSLFAVRPTWLRKKMPSCIEDKLYSHQNICFERQNDWALISTKWPWASYTLSTPLKLWNAGDKGQDFWVHCIALLVFLTLYFGALVGIDLEDAPVGKGKKIYQQIINSEQYINLINVN